jgi:hypothetical protein
MLFIPKVISNTNTLSGYNAKTLNSKGDGMYNNHCFKGLLHFPFKLYIYTIIALYFDPYIV